MVVALGSMAIKGVFKAGSLLSGLAKTATGLKQAAQRSKSTTTEMKRMTGQSHLLSKAMAAIGVAGFTALLMTAPQLAGSLAKIKYEMMRIAWSIGKHLKPLLDVVAKILRAIRTGDWEMFKSAVKEAWGIVKTMAINAYNFLKTNVYPKLVSFWREELKPGIIWAFTTAWEKIKGYLPQWVVDIANWTYNIGVAIKDKDWGAIWGALIEPLEWAWNKFKDTKLGGMITGFLEKIKEYSGPIREAIETLINWKDVGKEIWKGIWEGIKEGMRGKGNFGKAIDRELGTGRKVEFGGGKSGGKGFGGSWELDKGQTGLHVPREGLYHLHAGETVTMQGSTPGGAAGGSTEIIIDFSGANINLASGIELDQFADAISNKIAERQHSKTY
jgi:uncharacterized membrane protein YgcG